MPGVSGVLTHTYTAEVDHDFRRWLTAIGKFTWGTQQYQGDDRFDRFYSLSGDLIYKRGQAGVTKASVTIVFDNRDKATSPIGFEEYAQISVTRQVRLDFPVMMRCLTALRLSWAVRVNTLSMATERSSRRKSSPYRSAMSMLVFYINRAGDNLGARQRKVLERAKDELRAQFGK